MEPIAWYKSHLVDPYSDDAIVDQSDINGKWNKQYKCDNILTAIDEGVIQPALDLFLDEIHDDLDDDLLLEFYTDVARKMIERFHLDCLEDYADGKGPGDYINEVKKLLIFFGKECRNFLINLFYPIYDITITMDEQYIKENFNRVESNLKDVSRGAPYLMRYFLQFDTTENRVYAISLLAAREMPHIAAEITIRKLKENKND